MASSADLLEGPLAPGALHAPRTIHPARPTAHPLFHTPPRLSVSARVSPGALWAGLPSTVCGLRAVFLLDPRAICVPRWLSQYLGWVPLFRVDFDPRNPFLGSVPNSPYGGSALIAGMAV